MQDYVRAAIAQYGLGGNLSFGVIVIEGRNVIQLENFGGVPLEHPSMR